AASIRLGVFKTTIELDLTLQTTVDLQESSRRGEVAVALEAGRKRERKRRATSTELRRRRVEQGGDVRQRVRLADEAGRWVIDRMVHIDRDAERIASLEDAIIRQRLERVDQSCRRRHFRCRHAGGSAQ